MRHANSYCHELKSVGTPECMQCLGVPATKHVEAVYMHRYVPEKARQISVEFHAEIPQATRVKRNDEEGSV